jgi:uncharacterized Zn finger protein
MNDQLAIAIDTQYTDEIICPYCGCRYECSHELFEGNPLNEITTTCDECGNTFRATMDFDVTYCTEPITDQAAE